MNSPHSHVSGSKKTITSSNMEIKVYTLKDCFYCTQVKELFRRADLSYSEVEVVSSDGNLTEGKMSNKDFVVQYPGVATFPYVIMDGEPIGGVVDTAKKLVQMGLVTSGKKR